MFADKKKRYAFIVAIAVAIVGIVIALVIFNKPPKETEELPANQDAGLALGGINEHGFQSILLDPQSKGTKVADDKVTRYGYASSCADAVAAAFNYTKLLGTFSLEGLKGQNETYRQIAVSPEKYVQKDDGSLSGLEFSSDNSIGLFKIDSCTEGQSAKITTTQILESRIPGLDTSFTVQSVPVNLVWDNDWKLGERDETTELQEEIESKTAPAVNSALIDSLFTDSNGESIDRKAWYALDSTK